MKYKREYVTTPDGGLLSFDWFIDKATVNNPNNFQKLLIILHGLTGGSEASYIRETIKAFAEYDGYKIVVIHNRGINDTPLITPYPFHAGFYYDYLYALNLIRNRFPDKLCYALGVSMGANLFTQLLTKETCMNDYIKGFVSVSNPMNLNIGEKRNRGTVIDMVLRNAFKKYLEKHNILKYHKRILVIYN
jgi:predicted alpha/beta-fold hydrolase